MGVDEVAESAAHYKAADDEDERERNVKKPPTEAKALGSGR